MLEAFLLAREIEPREKSEQEGQIRNIFVKVGPDHSCHTDFIPGSETTLGGPIL